MKLVVGMKLYRLTYWSGSRGFRRQMENCTIKHVNEKTILTTYYGGQFSRKIVLRANGSVQENRLTRIL